MQLFFVASTLEVWLYGNACKVKKDFTNSVNSKIHFPFFWPPSFAFTLPFVLFNISSSVSVIYYHLSNVHSYLKCLTYVVMLFIYISYICALGLPAYGIKMGS